MCERAKGGALDGPCADIRKCHLPMLANIVMHLILANIGAVIGKKFDNID